MARSKSNAARKRGVASKKRSVVSEKRSAVSKKRGATSTKPVSAKPSAGFPKRSALRDDVLDQVFKALSDRTRRALLERLTRGPANVTELAAPFEMSLPAVSKHLRVLEGAGLVRRQIHGREHVCALEPQPLDHLGQWIAARRAHWTESLDALAAYFEENE